MQIYAQSWNESWLTRELIMFVEACLGFEALVKLWLIEAVDLDANMKSCSGAEKEYTDFLTRANLKWFYYLLQMIARNDMTAFEMAVLVCLSR